MTKAQEIRKKWLNRRQNSIDEESQKIFDWLLDILDTNIKDGHLYSISVILNSNDTTIRTINNDRNYWLMDFFKQHGDSNDYRISLFKHLQQIVEQEEGFKTSLDVSTLKSSETITFTICIVH